MEKIQLFLILTLAVVSKTTGSEDHWALLVAGSNGYDNYRHQADICHAYQVLHKHGIPDDRIVVMMYDDIANSDENPVKGNIINEPNGTNVYEGVLKDYTGEEVTPEVFLKVLTGDAEGVKNLLGREGKVIKSGRNDRVFVNFADHGAPGLLAFPDDTLHAKDLHKAIRKMYKKKQFKQMVFYVEACESGSMFQDILEDNINVFVTTAANPDESSYACYYDEKRETYLGDVYSVMWMEDSDKENLKTETLQSQFKIVKEETNTSHVMEYGDLKLGSLKVANFQGELTSLRFTPEKKNKQHPVTDAVPSEDVKMEILRRKIASSNSRVTYSHYRQQLEELLKRKKETVEFFKSVVAHASNRHGFEHFHGMPLRFTDFSCYQESVRLVREMCPGMDLVKNDYALRNLRVLANMCESKIPTTKIWSAIGAVAYQTPFCAQA